MAKSARPRSAIGLRALSRSELIEHCRQLYESAGISVLTFDQLKRAKLYYVLYAQGITIADLVRELRIEAEYKEFLASRLFRGKRQHHIRWTWDRMVAMARGVAEKEGNLPPAAWFQAHGYGSLVFALYAANRTWSDLRNAVGDYSSSNYVESRNGIRWLSHAEASLSNFLYARGIDHRRGGNYPAAGGRSGRLV